MAGSGLNTPGRRATNGRSQGGCPQGTNMTRVGKVAASLAFLAALALACAPARAQFAGMDDKQMEQFAPMLEMLKQKMGKRRFGQLMQMMGPMVEQVQSQGGLSGIMNGGAMPAIDTGQLAGLVGSMPGLMGNGGHGKKRRHRE